MMKTSKTLMYLGILSGLFPIQALGQEELRCTFNPDNVILPSSQYTPDSPYEALVWVFNDGTRYTDNKYNVILGAPSQDSQGRAWYEPEYEASTEWSIKQAPFSSDAVYKGQTSYQWVTAEIMGEIYMRRTFTLSELPAEPIYLSCGHDDAPSEWYINGELVHTVSDGWNNDEYVLLTDEQKSLLKADGSENLLAVHVHQNWGGAFADCGLYKADASMVVTLLPSVEKGEWNCSYYMLNYNDDFTDAEAAKWFAESEDESDWIKGVGPFSNDQNKFLITEWPSQLRPILIRRHFNLTADILSRLDDSNLILHCSYDENPKIYLNGTLIWSATGWNDNDYATVSLGDDVKELLTEGDNVLAVSLMQGGGGGHIDYGLFIEVPIEGNSGIGSISETRIIDNRIYNLQGRYLGSDIKKLSNGIYIVNGKKVLIRK